MFRHFFKILYRQFLNNKLYMLIKVLGLAAGMAVSLMIALYVINEMSYDSFHQKGNRIYNIVVESHREGRIERSARITAAVGPSLQEEFPEIVSMCRFSGFNDRYFETGGKTTLLKRVAFADSSVFDVFSFKLLRGNPKQALREPFTIVLTESAARVLFGDDDPMGKTINYQNEYNLKVTGVMEDPPENSQLKFQGLMAMSTLYELDGYYLDWDGGWAYLTYVLTSPGFNPEVFSAKLEPFMEKHINYKYRNYGIELGLLFDPLEAVYLHSSAPNDLPESGNISNIRIFSAVAIFILLIAGINFMNLSTARYAKRAREVGVRKVMGAGRRQLMVQFLGESVLISFLALMLATILVEILLPSFTNLIGKSLSLYHTSAYILPLLILIALLTGLLAGAYPAVFMSGFIPAAVIKGNLLPATRGRTLRNILVVFQFMISGVLIIATLTIYRQLQYMNNKPLGYAKDRVMVVNLMGATSKDNFRVLKNEIGKLSYVRSASASSQLPVWGLTRNGYLPEGLSDPIMINVLDVDDDYLRTMDIDLLAGKNFSPESQADDNDYLINQAMARRMGWDDPVGKVISRNGEHHVIGMVEDFHFAPLQFRIEPLIISQTPYMGFDYLSIRLNTADYGRAITDIGGIWKKVAPGSPFVYHFLNQLLKNSYGQVQQFGRLFMAFAVLAVFVACLGLFGLASFLTEQRRKEIGIRKTFGANVGRIVWMLGTDFTKMVLLGNLLAWPLAWLVMHRWLENFAYKRGPEPWIFIFTLLLTLLVAVITVVWQSVRAARQNPVDSIRYE